MKMYFQDNDMHCEGLMAMRIRRWQSIQRRRSNHMP